MLDSATLEESFCVKCGQRIIEARTNTSTMARNNISFWELSSGLANMSKSQQSSGTTLRLCYNQAKGEQGKKTPL